MLSLFLGLSLYLFRTLSLSNFQKKNQPTTQPPSTHSLTMHILYRFSSDLAVGLLLASLLLLSSLYHLKSHHGLLNLTSSSSSSSSFFKPPSGSSSSGWPFLCASAYAIPDISTPSSSIDTPSAVNERFPIVYVYTVVPAVCKWGLPDYIKKTLEQAIR